MQTSFVTKIYPKETRFAVLDMHHIAILLKESSCFKAFLHQNELLRLLLGLGSRPSA